MSQNVEILLEGSYLYFDKEVNYSQENFKLVHSHDTNHYQVYAEILSRIETGEFLKIIVKYEMNQNFIPIQCRIEKSIGNKYAMELYTINPTTQDLNYTFQNSQMTQEFKKTVNAKHFLTSPALSTAAMFTLSRKFDASGRTPIVLISSENEWTYSGPPAEKIIYGEFKSREVMDFKLHGNSLSASHLCLYEFDSTQSSTEQPVELFLSKHYSIPYQLLHGDQKIIIKNLKKNSG